MTQERIKLSPGNRWPKDRLGNEIDVGDYLLAVKWESYPEATIAKVVRIGKTGKVHAETLCLYPTDKPYAFTVSSCKNVTRLSQNMINAITLDKLSNQ